MSGVKPPEWDAMSANEQLLWYLKGLCAKAEEISSLLGVASVGDPPVVTPLVDPAASTTTSASSTPTPDVSCSTIKAQEVHQVIHDAPPASIAMAHTTYSTDGLNQVVAINSVNKVTTICPDLAIDLNATTAVSSELAVVQNDNEVAGTVEDTAPGVIITDVFTQRVSPVTTVMYDGVVIIDADKCAAPMPTMCSTECTSRDVIMSMSTLAAHSSTAVDFFPELTACDAGVEAFTLVPMVLLH